MLTVNEIFHSIQGESDQAGRPCVFVRLTACDLRCVWCDTPYAFHEGHKLEVEQVVAQVAAYGCDLVEITGGEPLLQEDVYGLMERLLASGATVMLETGGHLSVTRVPAAVVKVMDVKCPGSGECDRNLWGNLSSLTARPSSSSLTEPTTSLRERSRSDTASTNAARQCSSHRCTTYSGRSRWPSGSSLTGWRCECKCNSTSTCGPLTRGACSSRAMNP
jgi:7-carboxy-7-deazaguanine synthase